MDKQKMKQIWALAFAVSQMGTAFIVTLVGGVWLDKKFETRPLFSALGLIFAFITAIYLLYRVLKSSKEASSK